MDYISVQFEKEMDSAFHFVSSCLEESGHNTKPVLFHSFKVAMSLYSSGYSRDIVIASILHDLLEDTDVTYDELVMQYGTPVADIVKAVTFDSKINDKLEQAKDMFQNCLKFGHEALIVKCADLLDNIHYVSCVADKKERTKLLSKYELFLNMVEDALKHETIYHKLKELYFTYKQNAQ